MMERLTDEEFRALKGLLERYKQEQKVFASVDRMIDLCDKAKMFLDGLDSETVEIEKRNKALEEENQNLINTKRSIVADLNRTKIATAEEKAKLKADIDLIKQKKNSAVSDLEVFQKDVQERKTGLEELVKEKARELEALKKAFETFKTVHKL